MKPVASNVSLFANCHIPARIWELTPGDCDCKGDPSCWCILSILRGSGSTWWYRNNQLIDEGWHRLAHDQSRLTVCMCRWWNGVTERERGGGVDGDWAGTSILGSGSSFRASHSIDKCEAFVQISVDQAQAGMNNILWRLTSLSFLETSVLHSTVLITLRSVSFSWGRHMWIVRDVRGGWSTYRRARFHMLEVNKARWSP